MSSRSELLTVFAIFFVFLSSNTFAWPSGAPDSQCSSLRPAHGFENLETQYRISANQLSSEDLWSITIEPLQGQTFRGFILQARDKDATDGATIGEFFEFDSQASKAIKCTADNDTVTHISRDDKQKIETLWRAPEEFIGTAVFMATVVETYSEFYPEIRREVRIRLPPTEAPPTTESESTGETTDTTTVGPEPSTVEPNDSFYTQCGVRKSCFGFPGENCIDAKNCDTAVSVVKNGDKFVFELVTFSSRAKYVALALSDVAVMSSCSVMECVRLNQNINSYDSWMSGGEARGVSRNNVPQDTTSLLNSFTVGQGFGCVLERNAVTTVRGVEYNLDTTPYHLLVAVGSLANDDGIGGHYDRDVSSKELLGEIGDFGRVSNVWFKVHAWLMIVAWIGTVSLGIVLPRYFKDQFYKLQIFNKDLWFSLHFFFMVSSFCLTAAGFIIIFVKIGGWSSTSNPHPILGCITVGLCLLQVLGGLFRPSPVAPTRRYFNIGHFAQGNIVHILAIVTITFAISLEKSKLPKSTYFVIGSFVAYYIVIHLVFSLISWLKPRYYLAVYNRTRAIIFAFHLLVVTGFVTGLCIIIANSSM